MSKEHFQEIVERALAELPQQFAEFLDEVPIEILPKPDKSMLKALKMRPGGLLLGLYTGTAIPFRSVLHGFEHPNYIFLFQDNIQQVCNNEQEIAREIRKTVLHEIGHHFGLNEDDLDRLGYG